MAESAVYCDDCDEPLDGLSHEADNRDPCPVCGSTARKFVESHTDTVSVTDEPAGARIRVQEWIEANWPVVIGAGVLTVAGFLLGGGVGLVVGLAASVVGVWAFTRVREREVERF